jgi:two-component system, response regulator RpfG
MNYFRFVALLVLFYTFPLSADDAVEVSRTVGSGAPSFFYVAMVSLSALFALVITMLYRNNRKLQQHLKEQKELLENQRSHCMTMIDEATIICSEREFETINRLVSAIEYRHIETSSHIVRMAHYARLIAKQIYPGDSPMVGLIFLAAPMHDVGKIGISDKILSKPQRLNGEEYKEIQRHTLIGYDILKDSSSRVIQMGANIALSHHERFDGSGYPRGLKGNQIPMSARIVAVADYFDALISKRVYKEAWTIEDSLAEMQKYSGSYFDPVCIKALFDSIQDFLKVKANYPDYAIKKRADLQQHLA